MIDTDDTGTASGPQRRRYAEQSMTSTYTEERTGLAHCRRPGGRIRRAGTGLGGARRRSKMDIGECAEPGPAPCSSSTAGGRSHRTSTVKKPAGGARRGGSGGRQARAVHHDGNHQGGTRLRLSSDTRIIPGAEPDVTGDYHAASHCLGTLKGQLTTAHQSDARNGQRRFRHPRRGITKQAMRVLRGAASGAALCWSMSARHPRSGDAGLRPNQFTFPNRRLRHHQ